MTALLQPIQLTLGAQFGAALSMLHDAIKSCPPTEWDRRVGNWPFWQAAYHVLFYVDFYLSTNEHSFSPQEFHRKEYESFREEPLADENQVIEAVPQEKILGYVLHCHQKLPHLWQRRRRSHCKVRQDSRGTQFRVSSFTSTTFVTPNIMQPS